MIQPSRVPLDNTVLTYNLTNSCRLSTNTTCNSKHNNNSNNKHNNSNSLINSTTFKLNNK